MKKIMCLDVGDVRIGIATSDGLQMIAQGLMTYERIGIKKDTTFILNLAKEHDIGTIVIGLNKNIDGSDSVQTEKVYEFRKRLENKIRSTMPGEIELDYYDERYSTCIAEDMLISGNVSRADRKKVIDKVAACVILQDYLNSREKND